jgi:predicted transposase YdaD
LVANVRLQDGETFLLHIEIQNANDPAMPLRMLRYLTDILLPNPDLPWRQYLVYIGKERLRMADGLVGPELSYRYRVIDMHNLDCDDFLRQDSPDAWVLAILCDFKNRLPRDVIHIILARLMERYADNPPRLREYVDMLDILGTNRDLNVNIREELKMLTVDVEKLATYQIGMEKGMEKGVEQGRQEGAKEQATVIAKNLLAISMTATQVAAATGLPLAEVEALAGQE